MPLIEKRYADALVDIAMEKNTVDLLRKELQFIADILKKYEELRVILSNPGIELNTKKQIISECFEGRVSKILLNFLFVLLDKGRLMLINGILREFNRAADKRLNILNILIESATPLGDIQIEKIKEKYRKIYNAASVKAETRIDEGLLGGIRVVIGDRVIDASVRKSLDALRSAIMDN